MHKLANIVLLSNLRDAGLLQGDVDDMMKVSPIISSFTYNNW
jgi:hypothetical protein